MKDYSTRSNNRAPWYNYRSQIKKVILPSTLQNLGSYAFYDLYQLQYVYTRVGSANKPFFSSSVKKIGNDCFFACSALKGNSNGSLDFGSATSKSSSLTIGVYAFKGCTSVQSLNIYSKSVNIGDSGFAGMRNLKNVNLDADSTEIDTVAFKDCTALSELTIDITASMKESAFRGTAFDPYARAVGHTGHTAYDPNMGLAEKVGALVNKARKENNVPPLKYCPLLGKAAQIRSDELTVCFSHDRPKKTETDSEGERSYTVLNEVGIKYLNPNAPGRVGGHSENIGRGDISAEDMVKEWLGSERHGPNILADIRNMNYYLGCGVSYIAAPDPENDPKGVFHYYWSQEFVMTTYDLGGYTVIAR